MRTPYSLVFVALLLLSPAAATADPPPSVQLTPNPIPNRTWTEIDSFLFDPAVTHVVYESNPTGVAASQVFSVPITGGAIATMSQAGDTGNIQEYRVTGDSLRVVYRADGTLHSSLLEGGGHVELPDAYCQWVTHPVDDRVAYIGYGPIDPDCSVCSQTAIVSVSAAGGPTQVVGHGWNYWEGWVGCYHLTASPGGGWLSFNDYEGGQGSILNITTWAEGGSEAVTGGDFGDPYPWGFAPDDSRMFGVDGIGSGLWSYSFIDDDLDGVYWGAPYGFAVSPVQVQGSYHVAYSCLDCNGTYSQPVQDPTGDVLLYDSGPGAELKFTVDGEHVVLRDDGNLYAVPTVGGDAQQLNGSGYVAGGYDTFCETAAGDRVVYRGDDLQPGVFELFVVEIDGGPPVRISIPLSESGDIDGYAVSSDGSTVIYRADLEGQSAYRLLSVPITGGQSLELSSDIEAGAPRSVRADFSITPDSDHVVYRTGFVSGEPAEVLFSVPLDTDGDGDDVLDSIDCDSGDAAVWSVPGETPSLTLAAQPGAPGVTELSWGEPEETGTSDPVLYEVLRSDMPLMDGSGLTCVASAQTATTAADAEVPGDVFFYLVRAENACGGGGWGAGSNGEQRVIAGDPCAP